MRLILWKIRFALYIKRKSLMPFIEGFKVAGSAIENNPDDVFIDGPIYYAQEEMACWSD